MLAWTSSVAASGCLPRMRGSSSYPALDCKSTYVCARVLSNESVDVSGILRESVPETSPPASPPFMLKGEYSCEARARMSEAVREHIHHGKWVNDGLSALRVSSSAYESSRTEGSTNAHSPIPLVRLLGPDLDSSRGIAGCSAPSSDISQWFGLAIRR